MSDSIIHSRTGYRRLDKLRLAQSSSRILNLIQLEKTLDEDSRAETAATPIEHPGGAARFFVNDVLNRAIYIKHNLRKNEECLFASHQHVETKVFIPFDSERLEAGGQSFFIDQIGFKDMVSDLLRLNLDVRDPKIKRDAKVLSILRSVPSFDPFILRERLRMAGIQVGWRYFISGYDQTWDATEAVFGDFRPLIEAALNKRATQEDLSRFVEQVWNINEATASNLFFETLRIPRSEWLDIVFAWKALLYYRLEAKNADAQLAKLISAIKSIKLNTGYGIADTRERRRLEHHIVMRLFHLKERVVGYVENTSRALVEAVSCFNAPVFRETLREVSSKIVALGTDFTMFDQVASYYFYLYGKKGDSADGKAYEETLHSLNEILSLRFTD